MATLSSVLPRNQTDHVQTDRVRYEESTGSRGQLLIRCLDVVIASLALVFFMPLLVLVGLALAFEGGPILFAHQRIGLGGRRFYCLKFRSMVVDAEARLSRLLQDNPEARQEWFQNHKLRDDPRITAFGRFLRKTSLDELPQLVNVLRGEMSIVGPRPIVEAEMTRYGHRITSYLAVKPGITGIWQVSGRSDVEYRTRVAMDCLYAKSVRPGLYLWLVVATIPAVLSRRGSY